MPIRDDVTIAIRKPTGGNAEETHTLDALREYGTEGVAGALLFDETGIHVSTDVSTTAVSNWKTISYDAE